MLAGDLSDTSLRIFDGVFSVGSAEWVQISVLLLQIWLKSQDFRLLDPSKVAGGESSLALLPDGFTSKYDDSLLLKLFCMCVIGFLAFSCVVSSSVVLICVDSGNRPARDRHFCIFVDNVCKKN
jgi:hypothetical protein